MGEKSVFIIDMKQRARTKGWGGEDVFTYEGMGGNFCCFFLSDHTSGKWDCAVARGGRGGECGQCAHATFT